MKQGYLLLLSLVAVWLLAPVGCAVAPAVPDEPVAAVTMEIRLAKTEPTAGYHPVTKTGPQERIYYLAPTPALTTADIASARAVENGGGPLVEFTLTEPGAVKMREFTRNHIGELAAILVDGSIVAVPTIKGEISRQGVIHGNFTRDEAERIAAGLSAGR